MSWRSWSERWKVPCTLRVVMAECAPCESRSVNGLPSLDVSASGSASARRQSSHACAAVRGALGKNASPTHAACWLQLHRVHLTSLPTTCVLLQGHRTGEAGRAGPALAPAEPTRGCSGLTSTCGATGSYFGSMRSTCWHTSRASGESSRPPLVTHLLSTRCTSSAFLPDLDTLSKARTCLMPGMVRDSRRTRSLLVTATTVSGPLSPLVPAGPAPGGAGEPTEPPLR
mmetsp:Transcript_7661/g.20947  ORF Transcript_7661/g.20947 Transcript_7661/m.20947 type:complete len:228 (+) Transcript_7661:770-1453(+)